jgi:hypothetical protein
MQTEPMMKLIFTPFLSINLLAGTVKHSAAKRNIIEGRFVTNVFLSYITDKVEPIGMTIGICIYVTIRERVNKAN